MKVSELRDILSMYDPTMTVYVEGYEGGFEDIDQSRIKPKMITRDENKDMSYIGPHEESELASESSNQPETGIVIGRRT